MIPLLATIAPPHWLQFSLSSKMADPFDTGLEIVTAARVEGVREVVAHERHLLVAMTRIVGVAGNREARAA